MSQKIVINTKRGGFWLSDEATQWIGQRDPALVDALYKSDEHLRDNPLLVECVETLGRRASNADVCRLRVIEVPDGVMWQIEGCDGLEWVVEQPQICSYKEP